MSLLLFRNDCLMSIHSFHSFDQVILIRAFVTDTCKDQCFYTTESCVIESEQLNLRTKKDLRNQLV